MPHFRLLHSHFYDQMKVAFPALLQLSFQPPYCQPAVNLSHQMEFSHINDWVLKIHRICEPIVPHHLIPSTLFLQKICIYRFEQTIHLLEISDKHFHTCLSSYSFSISVPGHTKSYKGILQFEKFAALIKTSETGSTEASALTPSCIHISFFSRLISVSNYCKNHFYVGSKMSLHIFKR